MIGSITSVLILFGVGAAFTIAGVLGAVARRLGDWHWFPGRLAVAVDLLIGAAAFGEAAIGLADVAPHAVLWSLAAVALVVLAVFALARVLCRRPRSSLIVPAPRRGCPIPDRTSTTSDDPGLTPAPTPAADHPTGSPLGATVTGRTLIGPRGDGGVAPGDAQHGRPLAASAWMLQGRPKAGFSTQSSGVVRPNPDSATSTHHGDVGGPIERPLPGPIVSPGPGR